MTLPMRASVVALLLSLASLTACDGRAGTVGVQPRHSPQACQEDGDCDLEHPVCGNDGRCTGCVDNSECKGDQALCDPESGACISCFSATDCDGEAEICTPNGQCEACFNNSDCDPGERCSLSLECVEACTSDTQCTEGDMPRCNLETGECEG